MKKSIGFFGVIIQILLEFAFQYELVNIINPFFISIISYYLPFTISASMYCITEYKKFAAIEPASAEYSRTTGTINILNFLFCFENWPISQ